MEKSKRLRKAFFIVKRLPISGAAEGRAKPRIVGRVFSRKPRRGTYLLEPVKPKAHETRTCRSIEQPETTMGHLQGQSFPQTPAKAL